MLGDREGQGNFGPPASKGELKAGITVEMGRQ